MAFRPALIRSTRLDLVLLELEALQQSLAEDIRALEGSLGVAVPHDWLEAKSLVELRYAQIIQDPEYQPWGIRAITLREKREMIGYIGFHTKPGASYLQSLAPNGVEFGYTIFPAYRRNGYAREAAVALMKWAHEQQSVCEFVLSISPNNIPSVKLAQGMGFIKIGSHMDEEDGIEDVYRLDYQQPHPA
jgi:RimJ/RimL family protein N-acetyltransferase